jgi:hypothetical protein
MILFESERSFVIFSYSMSHGLLLLRSRKTPQTLTRIDILFKDVRVMEIRAWFDGIKIEEVEISQLQKQSSRPGDLTEIGNKAYQLSGLGWEGFILWGIVTFCEDEGELSAPSQLFREII